MEAGWLRRMQECRLYALPAAGRAVRPHEVAATGSRTSRWKR